VSKHFDPTMTPPTRRAITSALRVILRKLIQSDLNAANSDHGDVERAKHRESVSFERSNPTMTTDEFQ